MLKTLHFAKFTFTAHARDTILLPPYKGSTFRGGFGNIFKKVVCIRSNKDCDTCLLRDRCIYLYIFETPPPAETTVMRKYETAPHPFV
ncbi:MAG: CRISPR-associated protein Cas6, partial [Nitrospirota bacterium]|nr:CRISPR-associated protein Cas6 [Nitrospirota bacterium]